MKKRLRKKLRKGEFKQLGFSIKIVIDAILSDEKIDRITDDFIMETIEANDLMFGGGGSSIYKGFICKIKGSITEEDKKNIENWIIDQGNLIITYKIGALEDAWYPKSKLFTSVLTAAESALDNENIENQQLNMRKRRLYVPNI